jgi:cytochrome c
MNTRFLIAVSVLLLSLNGALAQDVNAGATTFKLCTPCHDVGEAAKNKIGPILNGLDGRKSGTVAGFNYTDANKNSGIVWGEATFLQYIKNPKADIPGTKMVFVGLKDETQAKNLWAYLQQFGPDGKKK